MKSFSFIVTAALLSSFTFLGAAPRQEGDPEVFKAKEGVRNFAGIYGPRVKTIAVITPGSYPHFKSTCEGIKMLRDAGYKVKIYPNVFAEPEGLEKNKNTPVKLELRVRDFEAAWNDMENDMIICARGGTGTENLVANVNWQKLPKRPELYVQGYSDVTMLLCAMSAKGCGRPVAGLNVSSHPSVHPPVIPAIKKMFHGEELSFKLKPMKEGEASGQVVAGLLSRFVRVTNAGYGLDVKGKIVIIESLKGNTTIMTGQLETLLAKGFFKGVSAVVFGHFVKFADQKNVTSALEKFAARLDVPVYRGFPFGHTANNVSIDFARYAVIKNNTLTFPAVETEKKK